MMTSPGRSPMFGRPASAPYAGGTGSTGSPQSHARREREDETGVSAMRQQQVLSALAEAGSTGLTWFELGDKMRWHHGQSSNALSVLHKDGAIAALNERRARPSADGVEQGGRGKSTVYVLLENVLGRATREPGQTRGNRELADANVALDRENAALNERIISLQAALRERDETLAAREGDLDVAQAKIGEQAATIRHHEQQLALAVEQMARIDDERGRLERGYALVKSDLETSTAQVESLLRENAALRTRRALIQMDEVERALFDRVGARLAEDEVAAAPNGTTIKVTLGAIRTMWTVMGRLLPDALPTRERAPRPADQPAGQPEAEPAEQEQGADPAP